MLAGFQAEQLAADCAVELDKVRVGSAAGIRLAGDGDRVVKRLRAVAWTQSMAEAGTW